MQYFNFNDIDYEKYNGEYIYGRIRMYDPGKGYGFIYTEDGKDIFISSYSFKNTDERFAILGTALKFKIEQRNSRYCAYDVKIINPTPENQSILLPNGEKLLTQKNI